MRCPGCLTIQLGSLAPLALALDPVVTDQKGKRLRAGFQTVTCNIKLKRNPLREAVRKYSLCLGLFVGQERFEVSYGESNYGPTSCRSP